MRAGSLPHRLAELDLTDPVVLALPRGGVPVALEVARRLEAPLDLVLVRKIGAPGHEELAAGAVVDGERPELVLNADVVRNYGIDQAWLDRQQALQLAEIERRRALYLGGRSRPPIAGRTAIVVDDGIATGATVRAALHAVRRAGPGSWCWRCRWRRRRCWRDWRRRPTASSACTRPGT